MQQKNDPDRADRSRNVLAVISSGLSLVCALWALWLVREATSGTSDIHPDQSWRHVASIATTSMIFLSVGMNMARKTVMSLVATALALIALAFQLSLAS